MRGRAIVNEESSKHKVTGAIVEEKKKAPKKIEIVDAETDPAASL